VAGEHAALLKGELVEAKGLVWLGTRTDAFKETVDFFRDVMGFSTFHEGEDVVVLRLPGGEWLEVFGPNDTEHSHFNTGPVGEFLVDDVAQARAELESRGVNFIADTHSWGDFIWAHFKGPDGNIYGITSGPYRDQGA
jgi:catechol 2,3-dioxygenase-like lactoylglutathione lyase family enzyme